MNLNALVAGAVAAVNPRVRVSLRRSTGYSVAADGTPQPTYAADVLVWAQVQPVSWRDLAMLDRLNFQGTRRTIFLDGKWEGMVRSQSKGGDLVVFPGGSTWLIVLVDEAWGFDQAPPVYDTGVQPGWTKAFVTLQNGA